MDFFGVKKEVKWIKGTGRKKLIPAKEMKKLKEEQVLKNKRKIIVYQTEPLIDNHWFSKDKIIEKFGSKVVEIFQPFNEDHKTSLEPKYLNVVRKKLIYNKSLRTIFAPFSRIVSQASGISEGVKPIP